jgi:hypothetical protein
MNTTTRYAAALAGVAAALAIAVPITDASAATTPADVPGFPLPAFAGVPPSFVGPPEGTPEVAVGPTVIGTVFNGGTIVQVVNGPTFASVDGAP